MEETGLSLRAWNWRQVCTHHYGSGCWLWVWKYFCYRPHVDVTFTIRVLQDNGLVVSFVSDHFYGRPLNELSQSTHTPMAYGFDATFYLLQLRHEEWEGECGTDEAIGLPSRLLMLASYDAAWTVLCNIGNVRGIDYPQLKLLRLLFLDNKSLRRVEFCAGTGFLGFGLCTRLLLLMFISVDGDAHSQLTLCDDVQADRIRNSDEKEESDGYRKKRGFCTLSTSPTRLEVVLTSRTPTEISSLY